MKALFLVLMGLILCGFSVAPVRAQEPPVLPSLLYVKVVAESQAGGQFQFNLDGQVFNVAAGETGKVFMDRGLHTLTFTEPSGWDIYEIGCASISSPDGGGLLPRGVDLEKQVISFSFTSGSVSCTLKARPFAESYPVASAPTAPLALAGPIRPPSTGEAGLR